VTHHARIVGTVEYREGDGPTLPIPLGPCEFEEGIDDVTLAWSDGETHGSTAMPRDDFRRYVNEGAIQLGA
jgi:hypothetical protein